MNTQIILVRHGEPVLQNALLGHTDSPLTEFGWKQLTAQFNQLPKFDLLVSSSLSRCSAFAQDYAAQKNISLQLDTQWRECFFGDWDGQKYQALHSSNPHQVGEFFKDPNRYPPPNAESLADFSRRIESAFLKLVYKNQGKTIVILTHAGVIRTLVAWCLKIDYLSGVQFRRFNLDYASQTKLSVFSETSDQQSENIYPQLAALNIGCGLSKVESCGG
ncbi:histidine phosphatase family protein [Aliikangiella sp. IMCC44632]